MRFFLSIAALVAVMCSSSFASAEPAQCFDDCTQRPTRMRSVPVFVTGVVLDALGAAATAFGTGLLVVATDDCALDPDFHSGDACRMARGIVAVAGVGALSVGAVLLGIGVPLTVAGAKSVPVETKSAKAARPRLRLSGAGIGLAF